MLLTLAGLISCQKMDTFHEIVEPAISENVNDFFQTHFSGFINPIHEHFFGDNKVGHESSKCILINSKEEFEKHISDSSIELPEIDFNQYTLIVGRHHMIYRTTKYVIVEQKIVSKRKKLELNMTVERPDFAFTASMMFYYWGMYPKLPSKPVHVNADIRIIEDLR